MKNSKVNRSVSWLNILLLTVNISAVSAMLLFTGKDTDSGSQGARVSDEFASLQFLKQELSLSDEQYQEAIVLNDRTFRTYNLIVDLLCEANLGLLEELSRDDSNQQSLDSIARKIGNLNTSLKKETIKHFQNVRSICDEDQRMMLTLMFKEMMHLGDQCEICNKKECPRKERIENLGKN